MLFLFFSSFYVIWHSLWCLSLTCCVLAIIKIQTKDSTPINGTENARIIKFETLRSLDPTTETIVEFDNSIQHSICRLDQVASSHPSVSQSSPILHHSHHSPAQVQIITTCPSPVTSLSELGMKTTSIITTSSHLNHQQQSEENYHRQIQEQQNQHQIQEHNRQEHNRQIQEHNRQILQQQQDQQRQVNQGTNGNGQTIYQTIIHPSNHQQQQQQITIQQQSRPIIQHHQIIETIKTEDVDIKPSIHELMSVGSMDVDGQQSSNNGSDNIHGISCTPEIGNMMTTPTQIGKACAILSNFHLFLMFCLEFRRDVPFGHERRLQNANWSKWFRAATVHHSGQQQLNTDWRWQEQQRAEDLDAERHGSSSGSSEVAQHEPYEGLGDIRDSIDYFVAAGTPSRHWWVLR